MGVSPRMQVCPCGQAVGSSEMFSLGLTCLGGTRAANSTAVSGRMTAQGLECKQHTDKQSWHRGEELAAKCFLGKWGIRPPPRTPRPCAKSEGSLFVGCGQH